MLDMTGNASVHGGRTRFLKEGDAFGHVAFFTGVEQMEVLCRLLPAKSCNAALPLTMTIRPCFHYAMPATYLFMGHKPFLHLV